jgi:PAS domain S-box-containing protein
VGSSLDGIITSWNPGAEELYGYSATEAIGQHIVMLVPTDRLPEQAAIETRIERGEHIAHFETVRLAKDQTPVEVALTISPMKDAAGRMIGLSSIARDITDRKRAERQALELAIEKERVRVLAEFVQNASHDFRTPLSVINTSLYLLGKTTDPLKQQGRLQTITQQTDRLTRLVDGLLTMTRLDSGTTCEFEVLDLNQLVRFAASQTCPAPDQGLILNLAREPLLVQADESELGRALHEVVTNALQYTPGGIVMIYTYRQNGHAVTEVKDNGIGIAEEDLPHVFERLYRADKARSLANGGNGLGLSIAKKIVEMHGGTIQVASALGEGSTVTIRLPRL